MGGFDDVLLLDEGGRVIGSVLDRGGEGDQAALTHPNAIQRRLPNGFTLVAVPEASAEPARRFARSFVHELRGPMNALSINLDLGLSRLAKLPAEHVGDLEKPLSRTSRQVQRMDALLEVFLELWAPAVEATSDLAVLLRSTARLGAHEANRRGTTVELEFAQDLQARIAAPGRGVVDALFSVFDESMLEQARVVFGLSESAGSVALRIDVASNEPPSWTASARAFGRAGANVLIDGRTFTAVFPKRGS